MTQHVRPAGADTPASHRRTARRGSRALRGLGLAGALVLLAGCLTIQNKSVPRLYVGMPVSIPMTATGAKGSLTWSATGLPGGLAIDPATGVISGTPQQAGSSTIDVRAVDSETGDAVTTSYPYEAVVPAPFQAVPASGPGQFQFRPAISSDGQFVAYLTADQGLWNAGDAGKCCVLTALWDRSTGKVTRVSGHLNEGVSTLGISGDGRFVAYQDVPAAGETASARLELWDRVTGETIPIPDQFGNAENAGGFPSLSYDGRYIAWSSWNTPNGTTAGFLYDRIDHTTTRISPDVKWFPGVRLSDDGSTAVYSSDLDGIVPGDTDGRNDVFIWNRSTGATTEITDDQAGGSDEATYTQPLISGDGKTVLYGSKGPQDPKLTLLLWDRASGSTRVVTTGSWYEPTPSISADGSTVLFQAQGGGLLLWDRATGATTQAIASSDGSNRMANDLSGDGRFVAVERDPGNGHSEVQVWDRQATAAN